MIIVTNNLVSSLDFQFYKKLPIPIKATKMPDKFIVETLEGTMTGEAGDYLIIGAEGEKYPCKSSVFEKTYVKVETKPYDPENYEQYWITKD